MPTYSEKELEQLGAEVAKQLRPFIRQAIQDVNKLPPLLSRKQFMEITGIGSNKANELFNRADFTAVTRQFGHPKVYTKKLFDWIEQDIENEQELNISYPYRVI